MNATAMVATDRGALSASVEYTLTPDDLAQLNQYVLARSPSLRRRRAVSFGLMTSMLVALWMMAGLAGATGIASAALSVMLFIALFAIARGGGRRPSRAKRRFFRALASEGRSGAVFGPRRLELDAHGLRVTSPVSETRLSWEGIERIEQDFTHLYLFFGAFHAVVVPKQALGGEPGAHRFLQTATALLGASSSGALPPASPARRARAQPPRLGPAPQRALGPAHPGADGSV